MFGILHFSSLTASCKGYASMKFIYFIIVVLVFIFVLMDAKKSGYETGKAKKAQQMQQMQQIVDDWNKQLPLKLQDGTIIESFTSNGFTITKKYKYPIRGNYVLDTDSFKREVYQHEVSAFCNDPDYAILRRNFTIRSIYNDLDNQLLGIILVNNNDCRQ